jgi:paraquat-inducible protein A
MPSSEERIASLPAAAAALPDMRDIKASRERIAPTATFIDSGCHISRIEAFIASSAHGRAATTQLLNSYFDQSQMQQQEPRITASSSSRSSMVACHQCDLVQYEVPVAEHTDAHCIRCNALLYRGRRSRIDTLIALTLGTVLLFFVSNLFPIASMEVQGVQTSTTLSGTALALYDQGRLLVAVLVFLTTVLFPALQLAALLYLLLPLRAGSVPRGLATALRLLLGARSWNMIEVFLLGVLVTLVKLSDLASIIPGVALWTFVGAVVLSSAIAASFSIRDFWAWVASVDGALARNAT